MTRFHSCVPFLTLLAACDEGALSPDGRDPAASWFTASDLLAADYVSSAANGFDLNDADEVIGTSYQDTGCGPFCLPPQDTVVWSGTDRFVLSAIPGLTGVTPTAIDPFGNVVGFAGFPGTTTHAVLWEPVGGAYVATDLGTLPGTTISSAVGIDDSGRVVGWSTTSNFPPQGSPFLWTAAGGMVDLSALGFPDEIPYAVSPGGMVATAGHWYSLDDPASVVAVPPAPLGFSVSAGTTAINDDGEQARFLVDLGPENLVYLARLHADGTWNQISNIPTGHLSSYGVGSISDDGTITATVASQAMVAFGPDGEAEFLEDYVSPAYGGGDLTGGGPQNETGDVLSDLLVGASNRVVILTAVQPCTVDCLVVDEVKMKATFVQDPQHPGQCTQNGPAHNEIKVKVTVVDETGAAVQGAQVTGWFLDDYWTQDQVVGTTNNKGDAKFQKKLPCGNGTNVFFVDDVSLAGTTFDRTTGTLVASKIPN